MLKRTKPDFQANRVVELPLQDQGYHLSIARVYPRRIDRKKKDKSRFKRREPVYLGNLDNGAWTIRFIMGTAEGGIKKDEVAVDYDAIDELGIRFRRPVNVVVRKARSYEVFWHYYTHPDMVVKFGTRFGTYGLLLSLILAFL